MARVAPLRLLALLLTLGLVTAACGGGDDETASDDEAVDDDGAAGEDSAVGSTGARDEGEPAPGGSISVAFSTETNSWRPGAASWGITGYQIGFAIMDPLMARTAEGTVEPYLAKSLVPNDDLTEYTLTLREGVTFHDGTPLNAEAIKSNFDTYLKAEDSNVAGVLENVTAFEVTGELTGAYQLVEGSAAFPDLLTTSSGMPFSPTAAEDLGEDYDANPVGTGPYQFVSWNRDDRLVVERYDDYWAEPAHLDEINFLVIPDDDSRLQSLFAGDIDAMTAERQLVLRQALAAEVDGTVETNVRIGNTSGGAIFNTLVPPVDDQRVRLGLAMARSQEELVEVLGGTGLSPLMTQYYAPDSPYYSEEVAEAWPTYDPEQAAELLQEYIDDPGRSDGKAPGTPIAVEFSCLPDQALLELAQVYQAFWVAAGVDVKLNAVEGAAHVANAIGSAASDPPFIGDYMINCWTAGGGQEIPYTALSNAFGPVATQPLNYSNYTSDTVDSNLEILRTSTELDDQQAAVESIMFELAVQVPNIWTAAATNLTATAPAVNGVATWVLPDGTEGDPVGETRWAQVWIDQ